MARTKSPYYWIADPLLEQPSLIEKVMFGCDAFYLHGRLMLVLTPGREEPWKGVLLPTYKECHAALMGELPELVPHPILGKWLYLSEAAECFDEATETMVKRILRNDRQIGVEPKLKTRR